MNKPLPLVVDLGYTLTFAYSFRLKHVSLLDTFIIGALFTLRLVMGTALAHNAIPSGG